MAFTTGFWEAGLEGTVARMNQCLLGYGPKADFPAAAAGNRGMQAYATDEDILYYSDGAAWRPVVGAGAMEVGDLKAPTKALDMNNQGVVGVAAPTASGDALIKGTRITATELLDGTSGLPLKGAGAGVNPAYGRLGKNGMNWTADKLLKGAGAEADPTEIDVPVDYPQKLKPAVTRWVMPGWYIAGGDDAAMAADRIYYTPIFVQETTTYIRIGICVKTAVAGTADLRIFNWTNGLPGALILSAGTVDTGTTGDKEITISQQLTRGYYFLAVRCTANPTLLGPSSISAISTPVAGSITSLSLTVRSVIPYVDAVYADPAPTPTDITYALYATVSLREN